MNARGSSSTISKRAGSRLAAICAPAASEMSRSADAPPVSTPTRMRCVGGPEFLLNLRPSARRHAPGGLTRSSRQSRSSLVSFGGSQSPAFGQETRPRRVDSLLPAEPLVARLIWWLPLAHELDLGDEAHAEAAFDLGLTELHQGSDIVGARVAGVDDEVRVLLADHRAADPLAFEARRFDQTPGVVSRWIAEDRAGVGLRQGVLLHAFIRHLFDAPNGSRPIAVGDEQVGTTAHHEDRQLVFSRDLDRADEIFLRRHAHEIVRGTADAERGVWREPLTPRSQGAYAHTVARSRRSSRSRSPAGRMSPAPRTSTRSPERAFSASTRAAAAASAAYAPPARHASARASARSSGDSRAEANVPATTRTSAG